MHGGSNDDKKSTGVPATMTRRSLACQRWRLTTILVFVLLSVSPCASQLRRQEPIVGHILPHSHCDAAYKKTVNGYYETEVRNVLNSILVALSKDPRRRFVWAETIFLTKWWYDKRTTTPQRAAFRSMVNSSQIELVCGGWVMHDEGITRYDSQIHQMTFGHEKLMELVGHAPRTGYQIDPFGASSFSVLLHKWAGMDMLLHNRIKYKEDWKRNQSLELMWIVEGEELFMHVYDDHYETVGFDWESVEKPSNPVTTANVQERTDEYMAIVQEKAVYYKTPHILIPFGGDFRFQNASWQFSNMDMIVDYANAHPERYRGASLKYTTVEEYHDIMSQNYKPAIFPVAKGSPFLSMWTGYYTTLPAVKILLRSCEMVLRIVETQFAQASFDNEIFMKLQSVRDTVSMMQHHDAITGTSYRFVILDYMKRMLRSSNVMTEIMSRWLLDTKSTQCEVSEPLKLVGGGPYLHETLLIRGTEDARSINLDRVLDPTMGSDGTQLTVFNSLAWTADALVSFVCSRSDVGILQGTTPVSAQATPLENELDVANLGLFLITFRANVPSLGRSHFQVKVCDLTWDTFQDPPPIIPSVDCAHLASTLSRDDVMRSGISSDTLHVNFDPHTNDISSVSWRDREQRSWKLSHDIVIYDGSADNLYTINIGPDESDPSPLPISRRIVSAYSGPLFSQVTVEFNSWFRARYRVVNATDMASFLQVSVLSGPIPPASNVASRFQTNLTGASELFYDENGFIPVKATYNSSEGVGSNIRPMVSRAWLQDDSSESTPKSTPKFTVFTSDPRGVVSRHPDSIDIFWQRRNREPKDWLKQGDDKSTVRSSVFLSFPTGRVGTSENESELLSHRKLATVLANDVALFASPEIQDHTRQKQLDLPAHMHLVSFRKSGTGVALGDMRMPSSSTPLIWIDIQIENLSEDTGQLHTVDLSLLLIGVPDVVMQDAILTTLTFMHRHNETRDAGSATARQCSLDAGKQGKLYLTVGSRRICSVRIPVRAKSYKVN